jgi:hypothetical protein
MNHYQGINNDIPKGAGSYVKENQNGGEVYNFKEINGKYYGYSRNQNGRSYDLTKIGANKKDVVIKDYTVVFFATHPTYGGQYVVGWYNNATIYKNTRELKDKGRGLENIYNFECKKSDGYLIPSNERNIKVPKGPGQTNVWYPKMDNPEHASFVNKINKYISNPDDRKLNPKLLGRPYQPDIEKKKKVELAAMDMTWIYYENLGFEVVDVSKENKGWDIEVIKRNKKFLIEVKGLSGGLKSIELSPNEYKNSTRKNFLLSVVYNVLDDNKKIEIFEFNDDQNVWFSDKSVLKIVEKVSATLTVN